MIVVSDTTPIHYLILIDREFILPALFGEVLVPEEVLREMCHPNAPLIVREWAESTPAWVVSRSASTSQFIEGLDVGENAAINIALEINAGAVLMDDRRGIREATKLGLRSLTTFALLEQASKAGLIDFAESIAALATTTFRMPSDSIIADFLARNPSP